MKKNDFLKGLLMTVIAFVATYIGDNIEAGLNGMYLLISTIGIALVYVGKNAWFKSNSDPGNINLRDLFSGLIIAVGTGIVTFAATIVTNGNIDWGQLGTTIIVVVVGYFGKNFFSNASKLGKK